jgi:predicted nucleic acid-binding protein
VIVVDAHVVVYSVVESEDSASARRVALKDPKWLVPPLWRYEVTSALASFVRNRVMTRDDAVRALAEAAELVAGRESPVDQARALRAALDFGISAYDAQYIALAQERAIACVTSDGPLARRAVGVAVLLNEFVQP